MWVLELSPGPLQEQRGFLTTEPSLHPVNRCLSVCLLFVEVGSHYVTLASLALNSIDQADLVLRESTCLCLPRADIKGLCHHAWL